MRKHSRVIRNVNNKNHMIVLICQRDIPNYTKCRVSTCIEKPFEETINKP